MAAVQAGAVPSAGGWGQALPPGWEAKYDPGQRRYFYINHGTQTTSWEDPRPPYYRQLAMQQQHLQPSPYGSTAYRPQPSPRTSPHTTGAQAAHRSPSPSQPHRHQQPESIPMRDLNRHTWQKEVENKYNLKVTNLMEDEEEDASNTGSPRSHSRSPRPTKTESKKKRRPKARDTSSSQVYDGKLQRLRVMFPTADDTIIKQLLIKNNNSEQAAASDLQLAGFQKQDAANVHLLVTRIRKDFPAAETGVIRDILHGVNNNETKARQELKSLGYTPSTGGSGSTGRTRGSGRGQSSSTTSVQSAKKSPSSNKPSSNQADESPKEMSSVEKRKLKAKMIAEFPDQTSNTIDMALDVCHYDEGRARTLIQSMSTTQQAKQIVTRMGLTVDSEGRRSPSPKPSPSAGASASQIVFNFTDTSTTTTGSTGSSGMASTSTASTKPSQTAASRMRHVRARSPASPRPQRSAPRPKTTEGYKSANVSKPNGPDTNLPQGPDKSILIKEYLPNEGADRDLVSGPDEGLVSGPSIPIEGADEGLPSGPNLDLVQGPDTWLVSGPTSCQQEAAMENNERSGVCSGILFNLCTRPTTV